MHEVCSSTHMAMALCSFLQCSCLFVIFFLFISLVSPSSESSVLINILTRTGNRPSYYQKLSASIHDQTYKNIRHIKSNDNTTCDYLSNNTDVISVQRGAGIGFYNLYLNTLGAHVTHGWVIILDDDSVLVNDTFVERLATECLRANDTDVLIFRSYIFPKKRLIPRLKNFNNHIVKKWDIDMSSFCIHYSIFQKFQFRQQNMGDYHFLDRIRQSADQMYKFKFVKLPIGIWANYNGEGKGKSLSSQAFYGILPPFTEIKLPAGYVPTLEGIARRNMNSTITKATPSLVTSAVIIEPRNHIALPWVIDNVHTALGSNFPIHLYHGLDNINLSRAIAIRYYPDIHLHNLNVHSINGGNYSTYMTQPSMYSSLPKGHTLIFQTDSGFCDPLAYDTIERLNNLTIYDYIGAPWWDWTTFYGEGGRGEGGNGGFSLRNTSKMLEFSRMTLRNRTLWDNRHPEDKHLSKICSDKFPKCRLPSLEVAAEFQNQHDWNKTEPDKLNCFKPLRKDPIGFHRPGKICHRLQKCPARNKIPQRQSKSMTADELHKAIEELLSSS